MSTARQHSYGLKLISGNTSAAHAVVILHGIRQTRDDLAAPFGKALAAVATNAALYVYGYDHTRALTDNGTKLAETLATELSSDRIDLIGYSMGGLVARLAVSDRPNRALDTVVTLATPNRGALSNAELETLGQLGRQAFEWLSPLLPRSQGVKDLTRVAVIMSARRDAMLAAKVAPAVRYASVPALFYYPGRANTEFGPSLMMSGVYAILTLANLKRKVIAMARPHDGIVTEESCDLTRDPSYNWSEVHLAPPKNNTPPRVHAVLDACADNDHQSILNPTDIARLVWAVLKCPDWRTLSDYDPILKNRVRTATAGLS